MDSSKSFGTDVDATAAGDADADADAVIEETREPDDDDFNVPIKTSGGRD